MYLCWVTTEDHGDDWFIVASNAQEAIRFHEDIEGYNIGDATAEMIMKIPEGLTTEVGWPSEEILRACGANIQTHGLTRIVEIGDRKFCEGLLESEIGTLDDDMFEELGEGRPNKTEKVTEH